MMNRKIIYLTENQVITINTMQIHMYSPEEFVGVREPSLLNSAINRPKQSVFGDEAYSSIPEKAAALIESLSKNHPFHNANKRTALASMIVFLKLNGYQWLMNIEDEQDFVVDIVTQKYKFDNMVSKIKANISSELLNTNSDNRSNFGNK